MPLHIDGSQYFSTTELVDELGVSRQTLWRWRQDGKIPVGQRFRDGKVLFTEDDVEAAREYARQVEPISIGSETTNG